MKTKKMTRTRCECEFCGKKNWSVFHMREHELHCTMNPDRICGVCIHIGDKQRPTEELLKLLPEPDFKTEKNEIVLSQDSAQLNSFLPALREACNCCPVCVLATIRQKGFPVWLFTHFDYDREFKITYGLKVDTQLDGLFSKGVIK